MSLEKQVDLFANPFRPGVGHTPPYLAGRTKEQDEFRKLLNQKAITENVILTGLRGIGKTVLLREFEPIARHAGWLWTGEDLSETASLTEDRVAQRIVTDLSLVLSPLVNKQQMEMPFGFTGKHAKTLQPFEFRDLWNIYEKTPGLVQDKLKAVLRFAGEVVSKGPHKGIVFAYDEAQNLSDHAKKDEYPLSLVLDVFQSLQRQPDGLPFMLVLTGLPTLFPKLNEARTFSERMFHVMFLGRLSVEESYQAITKPIEDDKCPIKFTEEAVAAIARQSAGYPYFIQFICKESFDVFLAKINDKQRPSVPVAEILRKLDADFFSARWDNATERQRDFMQIAALLPNADDGFSGNEIVQQSAEVLEKPFSNSWANQMLAQLSDLGFVYKKRHGKYIFAVPLLSEFILRQHRQGLNLPPPFGDST
ncbi:AAA family ATPase [Hyphomicrobium sp. 2TAF46]|uniref:AAA family ATPase n=1 Tax=Hyphomicrobium sp. 2TAF46 TaxID=3233019 RepID=UPI003F8F69FC